VDQIFALRQILGHRNEFQQPTVVAFLDFIGAFDSGHRPSLWNIMRADGMPDKLVRLIAAYYAHTTAAVRVGGSDSDSFEISSGVRQGCVLSPTVFNYAVDWILSRALEGQPGGVCVLPGDPVTDLTYADDAAALAETAALLQGMIDRIAAEAAKLGLKLSAPKSKVLFCNAPPSAVLLDGVPLETVTSFRYLGSEISIDAKAHTEVLSRKTRTAAAFSQLDSVLWRSHDVTERIKLRVYVASVRSVLLFGCETWPLKAADLQQLAVYDRRCLRRLLGFTMWDHISNEELQGRSGLPSIEQLVRIRSLTWFGHVTRMSDERLPRRALWARPRAAWRRRHGGQQMTWQRRVKADVSEALNLRADLGPGFNARWMVRAADAASDRQTWRTFVRTL
jgi:hypothetical protein